MPDEEEVNVRVTATSEGEEVYDRHAAGMQKVAESADEAGSSMVEASSRFGSAHSALSGLNLSILSVERGMRLFGIQNDAVTNTLDALVTGLTIARSALALYKAITTSVTLANWGRAISEVAASGWLAPVLLGIIAATAAAVAALAVTHTGPFAGASGVDTIVTGPRTFLAGEAGPESVKITPITGMSQGVPGMSIGQVHINVYTNDPDAAGRAVADALIRLKERGL